MIPSLRELTQGFSRGQNLEERVEALEGSCEGRTGLVLTCGPSLGRYTAEDLSSLCSGKVVIAVKQAIDLVGSQADFSCFNAYNARKYSTPKGVCRIYVEPRSRYVYQFNRADLRFPSERSGQSTSAAVIVSRDYDRYLLSRQVSRPFGPGIMHEVVLHLALHLGLSRLEVVGWDLSFGYPFSDHFDDRGTDLDFYRQSREAAFPTTTAARHGRLRAATRLVTGLINHPLGRTYNRNLMITGEHDALVDAMPSTAAWMNSHGCELIVHDPEKPVSAEPDAADN